MKHLQVNSVYMIVSPKYEVDALTFPAQSLIVIDSHVSKSDDILTFVDLFELFC